MKNWRGGDCGGGGLPLSPPPCRAVIAREEVETGRRCAPPPPCVYGRVEEEITGEQRETSSSSSPLYYFSPRLEKQAREQGRPVYSKYSNMCTHFVLCPRTRKGIWDIEALLFQLLAKPGFDQIKERCVHSSFMPLFNSLFLFSVREETIRRGPSTIAFVKWRAGHPPPPLPPPAVRPANVVQLNVSTHGFVSRNVYASRRTSI